MMGPFADWAAAGAGGNWPIAGARRIDNASQATGDFELMFRRIEYTPCFYLIALPRVRRPVSLCLRQSHIAEFRGVLKEVSDCIPLRNGFRSYSFGPHALLGADVLEDNSNRMDDSFVRMSFAILDDVVLGEPTLSIVHKVLVGEAVVPAAVPGHQRVGVLLVCVGELCAGERLNVEEAVLIHIGAQVHGIRFGATQHRKSSRRSNKQHFVHISSCSSG